MKKMKFILILAIIPLFLVTSSCGNDDDLASLGNSKHIKVRIVPYAPLVLHANRQIPTVTTEGAIDYLDLKAPNVQFRIEVDNKDGDRPITILLAHLLVTGPKEPKNIWVTPSDMTRLYIDSDTGDMLEGVSPRAYIVEVPPGRKSTCMHKVDYLELPSVSDSCPGDLNESDDMTSCCPASQYSTAMNWFYATSLQDMSEEELLDPNNVFTPYMFEGTLIGWFGTSLLPEANLRKRFYFQSSPL